MSKPLTRIAQLDHRIRLKMTGYFCPNFALAGLFFGFLLSKVILAPMAARLTDGEGKQ